ncbi:MAG: hypothetical protein R8K49_01975 [Mariprofundaceae bacterium]
MTIPLVIHDLQDSQMFALAQAAGRSGLSVSGTSWPMEGWVENSVYIDQCIEMRCLSEVITAHYARELKLWGVCGVWLPCVDDVAEFTAKYQKFLENIGMRFLVPSLEVMDKVTQTHQLHGVEGLSIAPMQQLSSEALLEQASSLQFPIMIKNQRNRFQKIDNEKLLRGFLLRQSGVLEHRVQTYIEGQINRMASVIILFDRDSRPVRGFTARRLSVADTRYGPFGETLSARAEWIPELYEAASKLLGSLAWQGFAEVECKQAADGLWYVLEINPRLSGWTCLAEADGAGLLQAYYQLCAQDKFLDEACLQHSKTNYRRMIATCYHDPEWDALAYRGIWKKISYIRLWLRGYRKPLAWNIYGAWDSRDLKASMMIAWRSVYRVWKLTQFRRKSDG